jgi:hypothetical protein
MLRNRRIRRVVWLSLLLAVWLLCSGSAWAGAIADRMDAFPDWPSNLPVATAQGDLYYPDWFLGEWDVVTTLTEPIAPLAPDVVTPGFESNQAYVNQPVEFRVRFTTEPSNTPFQSLWRSRTAVTETEQIIADRAFNGLNLARAYLGDAVVQRVIVEPDNPNRQVTQLRGDRQLVSTVTGRETEAPTRDRFLTAGLFQQIFRGAPQMYFNEVETATDYQRLSQGEAQPAIAAEQITAVYLSPQDPDYFKTLTPLGQRRPVALYRYHLDFFAPSRP